MDSAVSDTLIFLAVIVLLWFAWLATGGPERFNEKERGAFFEQSSDTDSDPSLHISPWDPNAHPYAGFIDITPNGVYSDSPNAEYITLSLGWNAPEDLNLTGWTLINEAGNQITIGFGTKTPHQGVVNAPEDIIIPLGGKAIITTGRSPIGISFGVNICSGYIGTLQTFTPHLATSCPTALEMARAQGVEIDEPCETLLRRVPTCTTYIGNSFDEISNSCADFMQKSINYNSCVRTYNTAHNFDTSQWRIFLGQETELWNNDGGTISLYDETGAFVKSVGY